MKILRKFNYSNVTIEIVQDDITTQNTEAIVNAANSQLQHGGGVAGAIVRKGGFSIQKESTEYVKKYGPVKTGEVAITSAGNLKRSTLFMLSAPYGVKEKKMKN